MHHKHQQQSMLPPRATHKKRAAPSRNLCYKIGYFYTEKKLKKKHNKNVRFSPKALEMLQIGDLPALNNKNNTLKHMQACRYQHQRNRWFCTVIFFQSSQRRILHPSSVCSLLPLSVPLLVPQFVGNSSESNSRTALLLLPRWPSVWAAAERL